MEDPSPKNASSPPNWDSIDEDIFCPLCAYNLRGLVEPRCPECGFRFDWPELLDPARRLHPYVFEHHPESNFRSFRRTLWGGLRPKRFWQSLHPAQPSHPRRLLLYWLVASAVFCVVLSLSLIIPNAISLASRNRAIRQVMNTPNDPGFVKMVVQSHGSLDAYYDEIAPPVASWAFLVSLISDTFPALIPLMICYIAWPWLTFASLMVFRWSMRRTKVNPTHVIRCVVYSFDAAMCGVLLIMGVELTTLCLAPGALYYIVPVTASLIVIGSIVVMAFRVYVAYKRYLRFDHPLATIIASQIIALLGLFNILLLLGRVL